MSQAQDIVERYLASWNETDPARRRRLIEDTWSAQASYVDPMMQGEGHASIEAMISGVQERFPGFRLSQIGKVDAYGDRLRFSWALGPEHGEALVKGTDFVVLDAQSRLAAVTGFIDQMPSA